MTAYYKRDMQFDYTYKAIIILLFLFQNKILLSLSLSQL